MTRLGQTTPLEEILVHSFPGVLDTSVHAEAPEQRMFKAVRLTRVRSGCVLVHRLSCLCAWVAIQNVEVRSCNRVRARGALERRAVICGFDCVVSHGEIVGFASMSLRNQGHCALQSTNKRSVGSPTPARRIVGIRPARGTLLKASRSVGGGTVRLMAASTDGTVSAWILTIFLSTPPSAF